MTRRRDDAVLHVLPGAAQPDASTSPGRAEEDASVRDPARTLRVATTVRGVLDELRGTEPTDAVRQRLVDLHDRTLTQLRGLVGPALVTELDTIALEDAGAVDASELRVVLAELVGWLEGLFHGLSADLVPQDDGGPGPDGPARGGHYL